MQLSMQQALNTACIQQVTSDYAKAFLAELPNIPFCPTVAIPGYGDVFKHINLYMVRTRPTPSRCCTAVSIYLFTYLSAPFGNLSSSSRN